MSLGCRFHMHIWSHLTALHHSYIFLTIAQTLYSYFIEGDIVFVGKRKTFDKRVSPTSFSPLPPATRPSTSTCTSVFPHSLTIRLFPQIVTERITITSRTTPSSPQSPPGYALGLSYVRSASSGKTLLGKGRASEERPYTEFFDERGVMDQDRFERWIGGVVGRVMDGKAD